MFPRDFWQKIDTQKNTQNKKYHLVKIKWKAGENVDKELDIKSVIGAGYDDFWRSTKRYVVCKGSRASKKSTTAALKLIVRLMQYPLANA